MVSGFLISPNDHERMRSGEAIPIWIWSNVSGLATGLAKLVSSFMGTDPSLESCPLPVRGRGGNPRSSRWEVRALLLFSEKKNPHRTLSPEKGRGPVSGVIRQRGLAYRPLE